MEGNNVKKFISASGMAYEIGDLYIGGGPEEVITAIEEVGNMVKVWTNQSFYDFHLKTADYLMYSDGSAKLIKSKFDRIDE